MFDWFNWVKEKCCIKIKPTFNPTSPIAPSTQEDPRTIQSIKNTREAFKKQEVSMQIRAMKSHSSGCDVFNCHKDPCFIPEPDKVVNTETVSADRYNTIRKKNMKRMKRLNKKKDTSEAFVRWQEDNR